MCSESVPKTSVSLCADTLLVCSQLDILSRVLIKGWVLSEGIHNNNISFLYCSLYARDCIIYFTCIAYVTFIINIQNRYCDDDLHVMDEEIQVQSIHNVSKVK